MKSTDLLELPYPQKIPTCSQNSCSLLSPKFFVTFWIKRKEIEIRRKYYMSIKKSKIQWQKLENMTHFWCTFDALLMLFSFFTTFTNIQKKAKNLRKFFPISKFTKLVNLLILETQGYMIERTDWVECADSHLVWKQRVLFSAVGMIREWDSDPFHVLQVQGSLFVFYEFGIWGFGGDFQIWISVEFFFSELDVTDVHVETWDSPGSMWFHFVWWLRPKGAIAWQVNRDSGTLRRSQITESVRFAIFWSICFVCVLLSLSGRRLFQDFSDLGGLFQTVFTTAGFRLVPWIPLPRENSSKITWIQICSSYLVSRAFPWLTRYRSRGIMVPFGSSPRLETTERPSGPLVYRTLQL